MTDDAFSPGERLWFRGRSVIFLEYYNDATALVRSAGERQASAVPVRKLARSRRASDAAAVNPDSPVM